MRTCPAGGKRCFESVRQAREATRKVGNRIRVYRCPRCHLLHVTHEAEGR